MKNQGWLLIGIGAIVLFVFGRSKFKTSASMGAAPLPAFTSENVKQEIIAPPPEAPPAKSIERARENYNRLIEIGITRVPGEVKGKRLKFSVQPHPEAQWCRVGDFDLMKGLSDDGQEKLFLLSLEPLGKGMKSRWRQPMSLLDLAAGKTMHFEIPVAEEPQLYGLFICSDSKKSGSCAKKQTLLPKHWDSAKRQAMDSVLYFQLIAVRDGHAHIVPSSNWGKDNIKNLEEGLGDWLGSSGGQALKRMDYYISRLQPYPARLKGSVVQLPLPYNDTRCLGSR